MNNSYAFPCPNCGGYALCRQTRAFPCAFRRPKGYRFA